VHSLILYGAIFFKKKHFIKIILTLFILGLALTFINKLLLTIMIDENVMTEPPFTNLRFLNENKFYSIQIVESTLFTISLLAAIVILLWLSSFYRLKEKEV
jgi:glucan phosphoethanolaminetransferase (alkaline phosphatase superfamily)